MATCIGESRIHLVEPMLGSAPLPNEPELVERPETNLMCKARNLHVRSDKYGDSKDSFDQVEK